MNIRNDAREWGRSLAFVRGGRSFSAFPGLEYRRLKVRFQLNLTTSGQILQPLVLQKCQEGLRRSGQGNGTDRAGAYARLQLVIKPGELARSRRCKNLANGSQP